MKPKYIPGDSFCQAEDELFNNDFIQEKQEFEFNDDMFSSISQKSARNLV